MIKRGRLRPAVAGDTRAIKRVDSHLVSLVSTQHHQPAALILADNKADMPATVAREYNDAAVHRRGQRDAPLQIGLGRLKARADDADHLKAATDEGRAPRHFVRLDSAALDGLPPPQDLRLMLRARDLARTDMLQRLFDPSQFCHIAPNKKPRTRRG